MHLYGRDCSSGEWIEATLNGDRIAAVRAAPPPATGGHVWLAPGFIDLQVNGYRGVSFNSASWLGGESSPAAFARLAGDLAAAGTTSFYPTVVTDSPANMLANLARIAAARAADAALAAPTPGIHLEGPYLAPQDGARGAHPLEYLRDPVYDEYQRLQEAAQGLIKIVTLAPERPGALAFIERLAAEGVLVSIGHSAANGAQIADAVRAGARLCTHLGNGVPALLPRHPNIIWEQLANDGLCATFIADGHHLPPSTLKAMLRAKGTARSLLVSDAAPLGGLAPGLYDEGRHEVLADGRIVLAGTPYLAGAGCLLDVGAATALDSGALAMGDLPAVTSANAARLLGLTNKGVIAPRYDADLVQFKYTPGLGRLEILKTVQAGKVVEKP